MPGPVLASALTVSLALLGAWGALAQVADDPEVAPPAKERAGEESEPKKTRFRDPEDGKFDLSGHLQTRTGFLPVPVLITEPAVGYGVGLGPAW